MDPKDLTPGQIAAAWIGCTLFWCILLFIAWVANAHATNLDKYLT